MYVKIAQQTAVFKIPNHINISTLIKTFNKLYSNHDQLRNRLGKYLHSNSSKENIKKQNHHENNLIFLF